MTNILLSTLLLVPSAPAAAAEPPKVALAAIECSAQFARDMATFSVAFKQRLEACGRFDVLDRGEVDAAADALRLRRPYAAKGLAKLGRELGAELVLAGRMFTGAREGWSLAMNVVDAKTGKQRWTLKVLCEGCAAENAGVDKIMAERMAEELVKKRLPKARACPNQ